MKKSLTLLLFVFLVLGIFVNFSFIFADNNPNLIINNPNATISSNVSSNLSIFVDNNTDHVDNSSLNLTSSDNSENNKFNSQNQINTQTHMEKQFESNGSNVHINREIQVEDGKTNVQIERTITYANGTEVQVHIQIQTDNNGTRNINEQDGQNNQFNVSIENGLNVTDIFFGNQLQLIVNLSNDTSVNISLLPHEAMQKVLEKLMINNLTFANGTNATMQLQEKVHNNIPQVVYNVQGDKLGKFLGVFKVSMRVSTEVDPQTGNIVALNQPWWSFLISSESLSSNSISGNETINQTNSS